MSSYVVVGGWCVDKTQIVAIGPLLKLPPDTTLSLASTDEAKTLCAQHYGFEIAVGMQRMMMHISTGDMFVAAVEHDKFIASVFLA